MGQKRRRIALSCVDCRRRKVKCDRTYPSCIRCQKGGYGDKCLYVSHTGPGEASSAGLPTPEDERRRRSRSNSAASKSSWNEEAQQYEDSAYNNENAAQRRMPSVGTGATPQVASVAQPGHPPGLAESLPLSDRRIAQLHGRLIELETMVYAAGGKPTSQEMKMGMLNPIGPGAVGDRNLYSDRYHLADQDKVLLRGKSFKTQYFGPSNTLAILLQLEDLSKFVREILIVLPSLSNTKHAMSKLREREKQAAKKPYDVSIEALIKTMPERSYADRLVHHYLDTIETTYRILHIPTFLRDYESYWESPKDARPEFVVQLLIAMSCMCCIIPGGEDGFVGRSSAKRETATHWINICCYWLDSQSQKHVSLINYQLLLQIWLAKIINCIKVKRFWTESGNIVRRFMAAGLHREPSLLCGKINTFDCEMRRRLWYTALELDLQATLDRGITPTLGPLDWDTTPPLNIDDESFDIDSEKLPDPKPRGAFTRTSFLAWAAESLPLRIEALYKVNSIRTAMDYDTIIKYDHQIRGHFDDVPLRGWREAALTSDQVQPVYNLTSPNISHLPTRPSATASSLVAITLAQTMLYEYIVVLHQPFSTDSTFKSQHFHSRVARRYACISTILLLNPQLSVTDTPNNLTIDPKWHISDVQRRFFAFLKDDYLRAALSLAHSFVVSTSPSDGVWMLQVGDDSRLVSMIEAAVNMLSDRVQNLGQGFHGYWITSSALSYVHSKQSPDVPRSTFARAAADRVVKLHQKVVDGQLPRAKRLMLPIEDLSGSTPKPGESPSNASAKLNKEKQRGRQTPADHAEAVSSVDGVVNLQHDAAPAALQNAMQNVYGNFAGPSTNVDVGGGAMMGFDSGLVGGVGPDDMNGDYFQDMMFGIENMDWNALMNADPTAFMMGTWDYPS